MTSELLVKKLVPSAILPSSGSEFAAGYDLYSCDTVEIPSSEWRMIKTGIAISIPKGTYARIAPRSGLAAKNGINVHAGVVDYDYRGEVCVILMNHGKIPFKVNPGDRIAQIILEKYEKVEIREMSELTDTSRGIGGFGSTGV